MRLSPSSYHWAVTLLFISGCGGAGTGTGDCNAAIASQGANASHDEFSGGVALGDWSGPSQMGMLSAACANGDQAISIVLLGAAPTPGLTYSLKGDGSTSFLKYGDSGHARRVWISAAGTVTINAIIPSTSDHSKSVRLSFSNVTANPALDVNANTATGNLTLHGSTLIDGVYLPPQ
jgi:hypothetical protein